MEETLSRYRGGSVQEFRFALSEQIKRQVLYVNLLRNIESHIKSTALIKALQIKAFAYIWTVCEYRT